MGSENFLDEGIASDSLRGMKVPKESGKGRS